MLEPRIPTNLVKLVKITLENIRDKVKLEPNYQKILFYYYDFIVRDCLKNKSDPLVFLLFNLVLEKFIIAIQINQGETD